MDNVSGQMAKLFHERNILLINFDRTTVTVKDVSRESVELELGQAGFVSIGPWSHGLKVDRVEVRRKAHRFDVYTPRRNHV